MQLMPLQAKTKSGPFNRSTSPSSVFTVVFSWVINYFNGGSGRIPNVARAVRLLQSTKDEGRFALRLAKRANRAGATDIDGGRTSLVQLKHAEGSILWE